MLKACAVFSLLSSEDRCPNLCVVFEVASRAELLLSAPPQGRSSVNDSILLPMSDAISRCSFPS